MSLIIDLLKSVENMCEELGKVYDAAAVLHLKWGESKAAWDRSRRLIVLVRQQMFGSPKDLAFIQQAKDMTELIRLGMLMFSIQNGLKEEYHSGYVTSVASFLGDLEREAKK